MKKAIKVLTDLISKKRNKSQLAANGITLGQTLKTVSDYFIIPEDAIKSESRKEDVVLARHCFFWLAVHFSGHNLKEIGAQVNRKTTSVLMGYTAINKEIIGNDVTLCNQLVALKEILLKK